MKRIYSHRRFPGTKLVHEGGTEFVVLKNNKIVDTFKSVEKGKTVSEEFADRRARDFFRRLSEKQEARRPFEKIDEKRGKVSSKKVAENAKHYSLARALADRDITDIVNTFETPRSLDRQISAMLKAEREETDPKRKEMLRHNILVLIKREV